MGWLDGWIGGFGSAMGKAIPGIGQAIGGAVTTTGTSLHDWMNAVQGTYTPLAVYGLQHQEQAVAVKPSYPPHQDWLHSKVERIRLRGREWLEGKRLEVKPPVSTIKVIEEGSGIPVKRLKNGDYVWSGVPPEEYLARNKSLIAAIQEQEKKAKIEFDSRYGTLWSGT